MSGEGIYANPTSDFWDDYISIKEYSTMSYNKKNLIPIRYKLLLEKEWKNFGEINISIRDYLNNMLRSQFDKYTGINIRYLPPVPNGEKEDIWNYYEEFLNNGEGKKAEIIYGNPIDENKKEKFKMCFELDCIDKALKYVLKQTENIPECWKDIYNNPPVFEDFYEVQSFLQYAAIKAIYPELMKQIDYQVLKTEQETESKHLYMTIDENDKIVIGNYDYTTKKFISLEERIGLENKKNGLEDCLTDSNMKTSNIGNATKIIKTEIGENNKDSKGEEEK